MSEYKTTQQAIQAYKAYTPVVGEIMPPPQAPIENEQQSNPNAQQTQAGLIVIISANLMVSFMIVAYCLWNELYDEAVGYGVRYFTITTPVYVLIITGGFASIVNRFLREWTEQGRIKAYKEVMNTTLMLHMQIEQNRQAEWQAQSLPVDLQRRIAQLEERQLIADVQATGNPAKATFVTPYDNTARAAHSPEPLTMLDSTASEAIAWYNGLFDDLGRINRHFILPDGRLQNIRMVGSNRDNGSRAAGQWLIDRKVILKVSGGYALNIRHFPHREAIRKVL